VHHPEKCRAGDTAREAPDDARLEVDHECVAEALGHEGNTLVVRREVGPLPKMRDHLHLLVQVFQRCAWLPLGGMETSGQQEGDCVSHLRTWGNSIQSMYS